MYPTRYVDVTFHLLNAEGERVTTVEYSDDSGNAYRLKREVLASQSEENDRDPVVEIETDSRDQIYPGLIKKVENIEDLFDWALHQQDANAGVRCAECDEVIGYEEGCSSPIGSLHKGCAADHEKANPMSW